VGKDLVVLGGTSVPRGTDFFVLRDAPCDAVAWSALLGGIAAETHGALAFASREEPGSQRAFDGLVARATADASVVCVATSTGKGTTPRAAAGRAAIAARVLPALDRHFAWMPQGAEDRSPWLLTTVVAHAISATVTPEMLDTYARTIALSLGRGDATSTGQNLVAAGNLIFYARKKSTPSDVDAVLARHAALVGLRLVSDGRLWPPDERTLAACFAHALAPLEARHARAAVQVVVGRLRHHGLTPAIAAALVGAIRRVPGAWTLAASGPDTDLAATIATRRAELAARGLDVTPLDQVVRA
jgi:hypothetical protein